MGMSHIDINTTLLVHVHSGGGAARILRDTAPRAIRTRTGRLSRRTAPDLVPALMDFFACRNDIDRLSGAQAVASIILRRNDFGEMVAIRDIVASQELRHIYRYPTQRDHTVHTLLLYLLGIWVFDNCAPIRRAFSAFYNSRNPEQVARDFLFDWAYAGLLHDVGYVFNDLTPDSRPERKKIVALFDWPTVRAQYRHLTDDELAPLRAVWQEWAERYFRDRGKSLLVEDHPSLLSALADAPWIKELEREWNHGDILRVLDSSGDLRRYAKTVATSGYGPDPGSPCLDHAVASALLLFRYSSFWYWLIHRTEPQRRHLYISDGYSVFNYSLRNITVDIKRSCRACALHNVKPNTGPASGRLIRRITLAKEPLAFLSTICDEIQRWDRFPAGIKHLSNWRRFAKTALNSKSIMLAVGRNDATGQDLIAVSVNEKLVNVDRTRADLDMRCPGWKEYVSIEKSERSKRIRHAKRVSEMVDGESRGT